MSTIYSLLTSPFGLPISPLWEWLILLAVGEIVHVIAWKASPGGEYGSIIYWLTKLLAFILIWGILYIVITVIKFAIQHWIWFTIGGAVVLSLAATWIIIRKRRSVKTNG